MLFVSSISSQVPSSEPQPNWMAAFSHRPELLDAWTVMLACIKVRMQPVRYELTTLFAAIELKSSYCALAHGASLRRFMEDDAIVVLLRDGPRDETTAAILEYTRAIVRDASGVHVTLVDRLRRAGLQDAEICDIAATVAARCFFAKYIDALGVRPDADLADLPEALRIALTPGRPISD